jgi:biofilm PGA synthesis N-glycosyltransferase PgaC
MKNSQNYILITPTKNEEAVIKRCLESVVKQTILPEKWIIISDNSEDKTNEIIESYCLRYDFITFIKNTETQKRNFASVANIYNQALKTIDINNYSYIGLLDSDIEMPSNYYEWAIKKLTEFNEIGLVGGEVIDIVDNKIQHYKVHHKHVPGAIQFFRKECFIEIGEIIAVHEGGWDALTEVKARMLGWQTQSYKEISVTHLKPLNVAEGNIFMRKFQMGFRDGVLGAHPLFEFLKCLFRWFERPYFISSIMRFSGYLKSQISQHKSIISSDLKSFIRAEQLHRIFPFLCKDPTVSRLQKMGSKKS